MNQPEVDYRELYLNALDPENRFDPGIPGLPTFGPCEDGDDLDSLVRHARTWAEEETRRYRQELGEQDRHVLTRRVLLHCAPMGLTAGAWLQWMSCAGNAETELALRVLALYASDVGVGYPHADRASAYRALMRRYRIDEATSPMRLATSEHVASAGFRFPGALLTMSRCPDTFTPELLGADLCVRAVGCLPALALVTDEADTAWDLGAARSAGEPSAFEQSLLAAKEFLTDHAGDRLFSGMRWALDELRWCSDSLFGELRLAHHPDYDMWRLICARARQAAVYHRRFLLDGTPLAEWFRDLDRGPAAFLGALARSRLVRPGQPESSPLLGSLIGETGPMFRVFTDADLAIIRTWIATLPDEASVLHQGEDSPVHLQLRDAQRHWYRHDTATTTPVRRDTEQPGRYSLREAYHALLRREDGPGLRGFARDYARRWLARSRYRLNTAAHQLPPSWDREHGLRLWLADEHARHGDDFDERDVPIPSRQALIDSTLQLAPLIMIDGGWIQGFTDYQHASSDAGHLLFQTYWDELGNGESHLNHPRIYRHLLAEMGVELPPTADEDFARWSGFHDDSFAMPVYWLSIARFPRSFLPEILGLNLAMELSGVGGSYRDARVALRHHGFSTQFVDIHNTIDNVSTGHSAWAVDAIDHYLTDLPRVVGPGREPEMWQRIRIGYRSLNPPTSPGARLAAALRSRR